MIPLLDSADRALQCVTDHSPRLRWMQPCFGPPRAQYREAGRSPYRDSHRKKPNRHREPPSGTLPRPESRAAPRRLYRRTPSHPPVSRPVSVQRRAASHIATRRVELGTPHRTPSPKTLNALHPPAQPSTARIATRPMELPYPGGPAGRRGLCTLVFPRRTPCRGQPVGKSEGEPKLRGVLNILLLLRADNKEPLVNAFVLIQRGLEVSE